MSNESIDSGDDLFPPDTALSAEEKVESLQDFKYKEDIDEKDNILEDNESDNFFIYPFIIEFLTTYPPYHGVSLLLFSLYV